MINLFISFETLFGWLRRHCMATTSETVEKRIEVNLIRFSEIGVAYLARHFTIHRRLSSALVTNKYQLNGMQIFVPAIDGW